MDYYKGTLYLQALQAFEWQVKIMGIIIGNLQILRNKWKETHS